MSGCHVAFSFVSDVLRQVIEKWWNEIGCGQEAKKRGPLKFPLKKEANLPYSETPIPASEIAKRINHFGQ